jgi:hypothetical protein
MVFGFNDKSSFLLDILGLKAEDLPRFRDCFYDNEKNLIILHTRTGGGNREYYELEHEKLSEHPMYINDCDDSYDCTYANFYFKVPDEHVENIKKLFSDETTIEPGQKWKNLFNEMDKNLNKEKINDKIY